MSRSHHFLLFLVVCCAAGNVLATSSKSAEAKAPVDSGPNWSTILKGSLQGKPDNQREPTSLTAPADGTPDFEKLSGGNAALKSLLELKYARQQDWLKVPGVTGVGTTARYHNVPSKDIVDALVAKAMAAGPPSEAMSSNTVKPEKGNTAENFSAEISGLVNNDVTKPNRAAAAAALLEKMDSVRELPNNKEETRSEQTQENKGDLKTRMAEDWEKVIAAKEAVITIYVDPSKRDEVLKQLQLTPRVAKREEVNLLDVYVGTEYVHTEHKIGERPVIFHVVESSPSTPQALNPLWNAGNIYTAAPYNAGCLGHGHAGVVANHANCYDNHYPAFCDWNRYSPLEGGISLTRCQVAGPNSVGTLGGFAVDRNVNTRFFAVTNDHVVFPDRAAGMWAGHDQRWAFSNPFQNQCARIGEAAVGYRFGNGVYPMGENTPNAPAGLAAAAAANFVDAALIGLDPMTLGFGNTGARDFQCGAHDLGSFYDVEAITPADLLNWLGNPREYRIHKAGHVTGVTVGRVTNADYTSGGGRLHQIRYEPIKYITNADRTLLDTWISNRWWYDWGSWLGYADPGPAPVPVENYRPISVAGDSGSFVVRRDGANRNHVIGIHWAGNHKGEYGIASKITNVQDGLGVDICTEQVAACNCAPGGTRHFAGAANLPAIPAGHVEYP